MGAVAIQDFSNDDKGQYFNDTFVRAEAGMSTVVGRLLHFTEGYESAVISSTAIGSAVVPLSRIKWDGLVPPQCVAIDNKLIWIVQTGVRTHKKSVTSRNVMALIYSSNSRSGTPYLFGAGAGNRVPQQYLEAYLNPVPYYVDSVRELSSLSDTGVRTAVLSPRHGVLMQDFASTWGLYRDSVLINPSASRSALTEFLQEARDERS